MVRTASLVIAPLGLRAQTVAVICVSKFSPLKKGGWIGRLFYYSSH
jgi:hypothetical protein